MNIIIVSFIVMVTVNKKKKSLGQNYENVSEQEQEWMQVWKIEA